MSNSLPVVGAILHDDGYNVGTAGGVDFTTWDRP